MLIAKLFAEGSVWFPSQVTVAVGGLILEPATTEDEVTVAVGELLLEPATTVQEATVAVGVLLIEPATTEKSEKLRFTQNFNTIHNEHIL